MSTWLRCICWKLTEKLVVFLLGVVQHQVADVSWHSIGIEQGFLQAMAQVKTYIITITTTIIIII